ncbi:PREDICTED: thioredoxin domain-containing protein 2 [Chrysochloris asiatica]|uniref:Thioredoxin domain-containing protein 2 n=1 Tax=Chrysochloris asiatica TaxID=185453 RepID=A0A9B0WZY0_CHRAS|nr:PREDICTED: thioredoxin domain-containing protein 2 [Chrysochloris asiatica]
MESNKVGTLEEVKMRLDNQEETKEGSTNESSLQVRSSKATELVLEFSVPAQAQEKTLAPKNTEEPEVPKALQPTKETSIDAAQWEKCASRSLSEQTTEPVEGYTLKYSEQTVKFLEDNTSKASEETTEPLESDKVKVIQNKEDFEAVLKEAGEKLVVVDFFATWCGPCKIIKPLFNALSYKYDDVVFLEVNADECEELTKDCGIMCLPTFQFYRKEEKVGEFCGALREKLEAVITELK